MPSRTADGFGMSNRSSSAGARNASYFSLRYLLLLNIKTIKQEENSIINKMTIHLLFITTKKQYQIMR